VYRLPSFKLKSSLVTILQGVEFSIFQLIFAWALQQCSANALPVIPYLWPQNSHDFNPVGYQIWDMMQDLVYQAPVRDVANRRA